MDLVPPSCWYPGPSHVFLKHLFLSEMVSSHPESSWMGLGVSSRTEKRIFPAAQIPSLVPSSVCREQQRGVTYTAKHPPQLARRLHVFPLLLYLESLPEILPKSLQSAGKTASSVASYSMISLSHIGDESLSLFSYTFVLIYLSPYISAIGAQYPFTSNSPQSLRIKRKKLETHQCIWVVIWG